MATLAEIKAALKAESESKEKRNSGSFGDNASYRFWEIPENSNALIRFLPDGDPTNTFFWVTKESIKLKFQGIVGENDKEITIPVPCVEMWGDSCPILAEVRPWWKDPAKESLARQYWKKRSYLYQGFVVHSPFEEKELPNNPIRRFVINPSIHDIVRNSLMDSEMEDIPTDYDGGRDFKLTKTKKPGTEFASYTSSSWSLKTRSLSEEERIAIEQFKLWNLKDYVGRRPDKEELEILKAMFHDSVAGQPFDVASYGKYYRPFGYNGDGAAAQRAPAPEAAARDDHVESTVRETVETAAGAKASNPHDILERIKNRNKATK